MRLAALLIGSAALVMAQGPAASIQITAPSFRCVAGERMTLKAIVRDATGAVRANDIPAFTVDNTNLATVEQFSGEFSSRTLGVPRITARIGTLTTSIFIQILPKRVVMTPNSASMTVGESKQFTAQAMDVNDRPLPNINFRWFTVSGNGGTTNTSTVTTTGMLRTVAVGDIQLRVSFDYNSNIIPGFERQAQAVAMVSIEAPKSYTMRRLLSTRDKRGPFKLRPRIKPLLGNEAGQILFDASLDGTSNGPLMIDSEGYRLLAHGGMPGPLPQTTSIEFSQLALNNKGRAVGLTTVIFSGTTIFRLGGPEGPDPVFVDPMPLAGTEFLTGPFLNRNCLNDDGTVLFRANYRIANQGPTFSALFRLPERGFPDEVVSTRDTLPNFPATFALDTDFGIGGNGMVYFTASSGTNRALFVRGYDTIRKVVGVGDALLGSTVARFAGNGFHINQNGELGLVVVLANNQIHLLRYDVNNPDGAPRTLALRSFGNLFTISLNQGALFNGDVGRGYGVHVWGSGDPVTIFPQNSNAGLLRGKTVPALDWAAISAGGDVHIMARTQDHPMEIFHVTAGSQPSVLLQSGNEIPVLAPASISNILGGDRMGPPHVLLGGRNSSIFEVSENGDLTPTALIGERFMANQPLVLFGGSSTVDRKAPNGDVLISQTAGLGVMRVRNGVAEVIQRPGFSLPDGATANAPFNIQSDSRGDLLWTTSTNRGDQRLFLRRGEDITTVTTNSVLANMRTEVEGLAVTAWSDQTLDDSGRVMLNLRFSDNSLALYLWDNGVFTRVARISETRHNGVLVSNIFTIRAGGDTFYAVFTLLGIGNTLVRYRGGKWESVIEVQDILATGHTANSIGTYEVNRRGDVVAQCNSGTQVIVVKRGDKFHYIHMLTELTAEGDLLLRTSDFDIRDDGTVYFLGITVLDEYNLYVARPM